MESQTDSAVMKQVQAGDTAELAVLFERYHVPLFQYLLHLSRNRALSEDLAQETFFRVLKYAKSYDTNLPFNVWLYRMARNAYFDILRKGRRESWSSEMDRMLSEDPLPDELLARKQDTQYLHAALQNLPDDKREVLVLSRFHNMRHQDIAQILNCETATVKVRVFRALKELRERFCEMRGNTLYDA